MKANEPGTIPGPEDEYDRWEMAEAVRKALLALDNESREVLQVKYGLAGSGDHLSAVETGRRLGLSSRRVLQIERKALTKLVDASPAIRALLRAFRGTKRLMRLGGLSIGDRVMAWDGLSSSPLGFGKVIDFRRLMFNEPKLFPEVRLDSGQVVGTPSLYLIPEKRALRSSNKLWEALFPKA